MELVVLNGSITYSFALREIFDQKREKSPFFRLKVELSNLFSETGAIPGKTGFGTLKPNIQAFD